MFSSSRKGLPVVDFPLTDPQRERERERETKTEETQLNQLENQVENGGGGAWEYLCLVRKLKVRRSEKVLKHGSSILNDPGKRSSLGLDEWSLYEQVAIELQLWTVNVLVSHRTALRFCRRNFLRAKELEG